MSLELILITIAAALAAGAVGFIAVRSLLNREKTECRPLPVAILAAVFAAGVVYAVANSAETAALLPLGQWGRVNEIGYRAVWNSFFRDVLPFVPFGFLLPWAFKRVNTLGKAALAGLGGAALMAVAVLVKQPFDADAVAGAFLGVIVGFGLFAFFKLLFSRLKLFSGTKMTRATHLGAFAAMMAVYFACVALILVDSGGEFGQLHLFSPDTKLPEDLELVTELDDSRTSAMTYRSLDPDPEGIAQRVAAELGLMAAPSVRTNDEGRAIEVTIEDGDKTLTVNASGEWEYSDEGFAAEETGELISAEEFSERALAIANGGLSAFAEFTVSDVQTGMRTDAFGTRAQRCTVSLTANVGGSPVVGSCEMTVVMWYDGTVAQINKYSAEYTAYKDVDILTQSEAWQQVLAGNAAHTLWNEAVSAKVDGVELCYWLEEIHGHLQPVWAFSGTAVMPDQSTVTFDAYVPALEA